MSFRASPRAALATLAAMALARAAAAAGAAGAAADSAASGDFELPSRLQHALAGLGMHPLSRAAAESFASAIHEWHEFYLLAGTAAVTLVGLLFVSLSFHLDTLLHESKAHLLGAAKRTFAGYLYVLVVALIFLVPHVSARLLGLWTLVPSLIFLGVSLVDAWKERPRKHESNRIEVLGRRLRVGAIAYALAALNSLGMFLRPGAFWLINDFAVVALLLSNSAWTSWDLLVQVGRMRRTQERSGRS